MVDLPRIPSSDTRVIFIQVIISISIAIAMKLTNGKNHHPQQNYDDDKNLEDTPTGKSSVGILGVCHHGHGHCHGHGSHMCRQGQVWFFLVRVMVIV